jgi:hypothetical protein
MSPLFQILARYVAAIFVAFVVSWTTIFIGFDVTSVGDDTLFAIIGFAGVFSGTFCLEQKHRRFGSIILLGIGLCFSISLFSSSDGGPDDGFLLFLYSFWPLMVGGTAAVLLFWLKPRIDGLKTRSKL